MSTHHHVMCTCAGDSFNTNTYVFSSDAQKILPITQILFEDWWINFDGRRPCCRTVGRTARAKSAIAGRNRQEDRTRRRITPPISAAITAHRAHRVHVIEFIHEQVTKKNYLSYLWQLIVFTCLTFKIFISQYFFCTVFDVLFNIKFVWIFLLLCSQNCQVHKIFYYNP